MSATTVPSDRKPVECGAVDIALYVRRLPCTGGRRERSERRRMRERGRKC